MEINFLDGTLKLLFNLHSLAYKFKSHVLISSSS